MKTIQSTLLLSLAIFLAGCGMQPATDNLSDYKNPNPRIEVIHVEAYNYDLGIGVSKDRKKANRLYLQAARAGDPRSMMNYAINRYDGMGTEADRVDAFYWIDRARFVTQNTPDMQTKWRVRGVYDSMARDLTPDQIRQARARHS
jgi:Sel1 repeat